ncbi:TetR family transcriptional regulator [Babesia caballi]|uniref:TetR family transcriptional regulator n=1 Tax=Babesia caballi TaxID=5871 RepID=A0AAV4LLX4_BABCB|nr:TetR family transcriptional regulator [Babesia caballi]
MLIDPHDAAFLVPLLALNNHEVGGLPNVDVVLRDDVLGAVGAVGRYLLLVGRPRNQLAVVQAELIFERFLRRVPVLARGVHRFGESKNVLDELGVLHRARARAHAVGEPELAGDAVLYLAAVVPEGRELLEEEEDLHEDVHDIAREGPDHGGELRVVEILVRAVSDFLEDGHEFTGVHAPLQLDSVLQLSDVERIRLVRQIHVVHAALLQDADFDVMVDPGALTGHVGVPHRNHGLEVAIEEPPVILHRHNPVGSWHYGRRAYRRAKPQRGRSFHPNVVHLQQGLVHQHVAVEVAPRGDNVRAVRRYAPDGRVVRLDGVGYFLHSPVHYV